MAVSPFDLAALDRLVGQEVVLEAKVLRAGESRSGKTRYLNFAMNPGESAALAFQSSPKGNGSQFTLAGLKAYQGKTIKAVGKLTKLHGQHLLFIQTAGQMELIGASPGKVAAR